MTDRLGALVALVHAQSPLAEPALERFHALAHGDALVLDKWFALQAQRARARGREAGRVFARAKALLKHPRLHAKQPEPRAQPAVRAVRRQPGGLPPRRRRRLRVLGRPAARARRHQPAAGRRAWRARWTAGRHLAEPYRSAAREAIARVAAAPT